MRILIAHSFYRVPGGEDTYVGQQVDLLKPFHDVKLLRMDNDDLRPGLLAARQMVYSRSHIARLESTLREFNPDLVHLHNPYPSFGPAIHLAAEKSRVPLVMTVHNMRLRCPNGLMFTEGRLCRRCESGNYSNALIHRCFPSRSQSAAYALALWTHRFMLRLEGKIRRFIVPSVFMRDEMIRWGVPAAKVDLVRNFTRLPPDSTAEPGTFGMYLGRLSPEKGLETLLRSLKVAGDPDFRIVGDGSSKQGLILASQELGLRNTQFKGWLDRNEVHQTLRQCRFLAVPSVWQENAPLAAMEAMAYGRPLLVTGMGGLPELVGAMEGLMCVPGDPVDLGQKIARLVEDDLFCREAGQFGLEFARRELGADRHLQRLEEVYSTAISG